MRKIRRLWALVLTIALTLTQLSAVTFAAENDITINACSYVSRTAGDAFTDYGTMLGMGPNKMVDYEITPNIAGAYKLILKNAGTSGTGGVTVHVYVEDEEKLVQDIETGDWTDGHDFEIGTIKLTDGKNKVSIMTTASGTQTICLRNMLFEYQEPAPPAEFVSFSLDDTEIQDGDVIARGTDCIAASFTEAITSASAALTAEDGTEISAAVKAEDKTVKVILNETLDYSKEYKLSLTNVIDTNGDACDVPELNFSTADKAGDSGAASVKITACAISGLSVTLEAKMLGSEGQEIKGRSTVVTLKNPSGKIADKQTIVSGENGIVSYAYILSEDSPEGSYAITADGEYAAEKVSETLNFSSDFDVEDIVRNANTFDNNVTADSLNVYGSTIGLGPGPTVEYDMVIPKKGKYAVSVHAGTDAGGVTLDLYVNGTKKISKKIETNGWSESSDFEIGKVDLSAGKNTIGIAVNGRNMQFYTITLSYLKPAKFESYSVGKKLLTYGDTVQRGTDVITAVFTEAVASADVSITDEGGKEIAAEAEISGKNVIIKLKETLDYSKTYKLAVSNVADENENVCDVPEISFITSDSSMDIGSGSMRADSCSIGGMTFTLKGTALGSGGQGIKGRKVNITVQNPSMEAIKTDSLKSGTDGGITYTYTLPENSPDGAYTFAVSGEYNAKEVTITCRYVSVEMQKTIFEAFDEADTSKDVEDIFSTYSEELGISIFSILALEDTNSFYSRFIGAQFDSLADFDEAYLANYALELLDAAKTTAELEKVILDDSYAEALGIDSGKYAALSSKKTMLAEGLLNLERQENAVAFAKNYNTLANDAMAAEIGKSNVTLNVEDKKVKEDQTAETTLKCEKPITGVSAYTIEVTCESSEAAGRFRVETSNGKVSKNVSGKTAVFDVTDVDTAKKLENLGTLCYDTDEAEKAEFEITGKVVYNADTIPYDIICVIDKSEASVTVSKGESGRGSGNGGGRTASTSAAVNASGVNNVKEDETKNDEPENPFDDIEDVVWAYESIMELYNRGIVSDSEDRKFRPNDSISRAEFVKLLVVSLGINDEAAEVDFSDVAKDAWYYRCVANAVNYGLIKGDENNCFNPEAGITREDVCVIFSRVMEKLGYPEEVNTEAELFNDDAAISGYAKEAVYIMRSYEIVNGVGYGMFDPQGGTTRAMAAKMLVYFLEAMNI